MNKTNDRVASLGSKKCLITSTDNHKKRGDLFFTYAEVVVPKEKHFYSVSNSGIHGVSR